MADAIPTNAMFEKRSLEWEMMIDKIIRDTEAKRGNSIWRGGLTDLNSADKYKMKTESCSWNAFSDYLTSS